MCPKTIRFFVYRGQRYVEIKVRLPNNAWSRRPRRLFESMDDVQAAWDEADAYIKHVLGVPEKP
jgi:hypothetical protein